MYFRKSLNIICVVLLATILFSLAVPEVTFAAEEPEIGSVLGTVRGQKEDRPSKTVICSLQPASIPYASDETDQGRTYLNASTGNQTQRSISLRNYAWLLSVNSEQKPSFTREYCSQRSTADFFDDLFIIHFIHNQDGQKG